MTISGIIKGIVQDSDECEEALQERMNQPVPKEHRRIYADDPETSRQQNLLLERLSVRLNHYRNMPLTRNTHVSGCVSLRIIRHEIELVLQDAATSLGMPLRSVNALRDYIEQALIINGVKFTELERDPFLPLSGRIDPRWT